MPSSKKHINNPEGLNMKVMFIEQTYAKKLWWNTKQPGVLCVNVTRIEKLMDFIKANESVDKFILKVPGASFSSLVPKTDEDIFIPPKRIQKMRRNDDLSLKVASDDVIDNCAQMHNNAQNSVNLLVKSSAQMKKKIKKTKAQKCKVLQQMSSLYTEPAVVEDISAVQVNREKVNSKRLHELESQIFAKVVNDTRVAAKSRKRKRNDKKRKKRVFDRVKKKRVKSQRRVPFEFNSANLEPIGGGPAWSNGLLQSNGTSALHRYFNDPPNEQNSANPQSFSNDVFHLRNGGPNFGSSNGLPYASWKLTEDMQHNQVRRDISRLEREIQNIRNQQALLGEKHLQNNQHGQRLQMHCDGYPAHNIKREPQFS